MIKLEHITQTYVSPDGTAFDALKDVSIHIRSGEIFGIIGRSGAGKSTLVRCINLLNRPTSGSVIVDGQDLTKLSDDNLRKVRRSIGMIFQHFNLMRSRTVGENVSFQAARSSASASPAHSQTTRKCFCRTKQPLRSTPKPPSPPWSS